MNKFFRSFIAALILTLGAAANVTAQGVVRGPGQVNLEATNPAASATAAAVPGSASYEGINVGGNLVGLTGLTLGSHNAQAMMIVDGSGVQITSFGGGTQYAVDAALGSTPTGTLAIAIRDDALSALTPVEGDAIGLRVGSTGALWVTTTGTTTIAGAVTNAGTFAVQAAQSGTWTVQPGNSANSTPWLSTIAQGGFSATVRDLANDALNVAIVDASGDQITTFGGGTQYAVDAALGATPTGNLMVAIRDDALSALTPVEGDAIGLRVGSTGALWTTVTGTVTIAGAVTNAGTFVVQVDGSALTALQNIDTDATTIIGHVDGLETLIGTTNTSLTTIDGRVDGIEALLTTENTNSATIAGDTSDIEVAIEGLDHAEDSAHVSGHFGIMPMGVRQDSQVDFGADGDYVPFSINDAGELRVAFAGAAGGTSLADDADFSDGSTPGTPIGGVAESASPTPVTEGDFGWAAITLNRALKVSLYTPDGTAITPGTDYTHDVDLTESTTAGPMGMHWAFNFDGAAMPSPISGEGEAVMSVASLYGVQYVMVVNEDGSLERGTATTPYVVGDGSGALNVVCDSGCSGGTSDADDASIATGQTIGLVGALANVFDGSVWRRFTIGTAGTPSAQVVSIQGVASGTAVTVSDGSGSMNVVIDSSATLTVTATNLDVQSNGADLLSEATFLAAFGTAGASDTQVLSIQGVASGTAVIVGDGSGALNTVVDSGTITTVSTVTSITGYNGTTMALNSGTIAAGSPRITIATDDPVNDSLVNLDIALNADEGTFTYATTQVLAIGAVAESTTDTLTDGQVGAPVMTLSRFLRTTPSGYSTGGATVVKMLSDNSNNDDLTEICATACTVYSITAFNHAATAAFLRCEADTSANTVPGSETSSAGEFDFEIPGQTTGAGFQATFPVGVSYTALSCWIATGEASSDATDAAQDDVRVFFTRVL